MSAQPPEIDPVMSGARERDGYQRLWRAALSNLLADGHAYWLGKVYQLGATPLDLAEAFDDLVECGPITMRLAAWNGLDPNWVSTNFLCSCENTKPDVT